MRARVRGWEDVQASRHAFDTTENNVIFGGLGSAVAEVLVENLPIPMQCIGVQDTFAEPGPYLALLDKCGLPAPHIVNAVRDIFARKGQK